MEIKRAKRVNARALAWEIRKATGLNCGGYNQVGGTLQTGSIRENERDGVVVDLPPGTTPAVLAAVEALVDAHVAGGLPVDFPPDPPVVPPPPDPDIAAFASGTTDARVAILGRRAGLL